MAVAPETAALGSTVLKKRRGDAVAAAHATILVAQPSALPADISSTVAVKSKMRGGKRVRASQPSHGGGATTVAQRQSEAAAKAANVSASTHTELIISTPIPDVHPIIQVPITFT